MSASVPVSVVDPHPCFFTFHYYPFLQFLKKWKVTMSLMSIIRVFLRRILVKVIFENICIVMMPKETLLEHA